MFSMYRRNAVLAAALPHTPLKELAALYLHRKTPTA